MCPDSNDIEELPEQTEEGTEEGLLRLRQVTQMTGYIHDAQMLQLKLWPKVLFDCSKHSIDYDSEERVLILTLYSEGALVSDDSLQKRLRELEKWCHRLLGDDWAIEIWSKVGKKKAVPLLRGKREKDLPGVAKLQVGLGETLITEFRKYQRPNQAQAALAVSGDLPPILEKK